MKEYLRAVQRAPRLNDEQHKVLLWQYRNNNDLTALKDLMLSSGKLVLKFSRTMCRNRFCKGVDLDDFIQAGNEGVLCAIRLFKGQCPFLSYAKHWIKGKQWKLVQGVNLINPRLTHMSRKHGGKFFYNLASLIQIINAWNPDEKVRLREEFSNRLNVPIDLIIQVEARYHSVSCMPLFEDEAGNDNGLDQHIDYQLLKQEVKHSIEKLKAEHKIIIIERFFKDPPKTAKALAQELGVHRRTIDDRRLRALRALKESFSKNPIIQELVA